MSGPRMWLPWPFTRRPDGVYMLDSTPETGPAGTALSGIRVVELANFISGPFIGMQLADYGADVIKIEHPTRGDGLRGWGNLKNGIGLYPRFSPQQTSVSADLGTPLVWDRSPPCCARGCAHRESVPGTLEDWGLARCALRHHPRLVLVRSWVRQSGPYRARSGLVFAEAMTALPTPTAL